jgi:hypothetical protein
MTTPAAQANQDQIARDEARDAVTDDMADLVVKYITDTALLTPADLRIALEVALDLNLPAT